MVNEIKSAKIGGTNFGDAYEADNTDFNTTLDIIISGMVTQAQIPFSILKSAGAFTNEGNFAAERYVDATGANNTVNVTNVSTNIGDTSATFSTNKYVIAPIRQIDATDTIYNPDTLDVTNVFDNNDATYVQVGGAIEGTHIVDVGIEFASPKVVSHFKAIGSAYSPTGTNSPSTRVTMYKKVSGSWVVIYDSGLSEIPDTKALNYTYEPLGEEIEGLRMRLEARRLNTSEHWARANELQYWVENDEATIKCENLLTLDGTEQAISVYNSCLIPTGSSMSIKLGDGTDFTADYAVVPNAVIIIPVKGILSSGSLEIVKTLTKVGASVTPEDYGSGLHTLK